MLSFNPVVLKIFKNPQMSVPKGLMKQIDIDVFSLEN